jgi:predicted GNAT superfamily acetyltransferase
MTSDYPIRLVRAFDQLRPIVELQRTYWGDDLESVIPAHMLFSLANNGGHVLAAYDGDRPIAMLVGFLGTSEDNDTRPAMANLQIVSKRMVVLSEYRGQGIAYRLKKRQRELAIAQGVRLITWTFDPLLAQNAHLNIRKLGAIVPLYLRDYYGTDDAGGLAVLGSSDRLFVEWWVTNRRVEERLFGKRMDITLAQYLEAATPIINPTRISDDGAIVPTEPNEMPSGSLALLEIPAQYPAIQRDNPTLARAWRAHVRALFERMLRHGFVVTDFLHHPYQGRDRAFYLMSYNGPQADTTLN